MYLTYGCSTTHYYKEKWKCKKFWRGSCLTKLPRRRHFAGNMIYKVKTAVTKKKFLLGKAMQLFLGKMVHNPFCRILQKNPIKSHKFLKNVSIVYCKKLKAEMKVPMSLDIYITYDTRPKYLLSILTKECDSSAWLFLSHGFF